MIEMGKEDFKLLGEAVDTAKMKEGVERVYQDVRQRGDYGEDYLDFDKINQMMQKGMERLPKIRDFLNEHVGEDLKDKAKEFVPMVLAKIRDLKDKAKEFLPKLWDLTDKAVEFLPKMWNFVKENVGKGLKNKSSETAGEEETASETAGEDYWNWFWN